MNQDKIILPAHQIPSFRTSKAIERGVEKNILFKTYGGLGDQICSEPTLRYAIDTFKGCDISLASECPDLFKHLKFKNVYDLKKEKPDYDKYFVFNTIVDTSNLVWEFFSHMITNCVDFPSLCALRCQIPNSYKQLQISSTFPEKYGDINYSECVFIHAGRHWPSKTFPKEFWDAVIDEVLEQKCVPVLIGGDTDDNRGTVDVNSAGCIDLRNRLSISESIYVLQQAKILITNDSAPLHMAASGDAYIAYIATCKHPDHISHWRNGEFGYRMKNFGKGGIWNVLDYCPNKDNEVTAEFVPDELLRSWLPDPAEIAGWAASKLNF